MSDRPETSDALSPHDYGDMARMAQFTNSDDSPTDLNNNAVTARSQGLTVDMAGKGFVAMQERRQIIADNLLNK